MDKSASNGVEASKHTPAWFDLFAIVVCTAAWGTTWFAITLQLGAVDPVVSITYRFALAAALLFGWCALRGERISLTPIQHRAVFGMGLFTFAIDYAFVYWAEERITSAVVAVVFAAMAFVNLITFRLVFRQRAPALAWGAAGLGVVGVALLSWEEIATSQMGQRALIGIGLTFASVVLALFAVATGRTWGFEPTWPYTLSLLHLAINGSVVAFLLYYGLARRRGYSTASYISALTPPVAMAVSSVFEGKSWGLMALGGVALVLVGQYLLLRASRC